MTVILKLHFICQSILFAD